VGAIVAAVIHSFVASSEAEAAEIAQPAAVSRQE
jgi:hypothetical protein